MLYVCRLSVSNDLKYDAIRYCTCYAQHIIINCYIYQNFFPFPLPSFVFLHFPPAHHSFQHFVFLVYLVIFFVYRDLHDVGAKKISVFALNKVSEPSFVARNLIIIILYSSVMVKSVAREMGGSRKE